MAKICWIIGASYGIGESLSYKYYQQGYDVIISARSKDKLQKIKNNLQKSKSLQKVTILDFDVCDYKKFSNACDIILKKFKKIDLAFYAPAIYKPENIYKFDINYSHQILSVNLGGCLNFLNIITPIMKRQKYGHIALIASVAGYCGLPNSLTYGATKAAIINLAEGIYNQLKANNINLSLINPGFVATRLTKKNKFYMPLIISSSQAANIIYSNINKNKFEITFPKRFTIIIKILKLLPYKIFFYLTKKLQS